MKDIVITGAKVRRELWWLLAAFVLANMLNIYSIIAYGTEWKELATALGYVIAFSLVLYAVIGLIRLLVSGVRRLARRGQAA